MALIKTDSVMPRQFFRRLCIKEVAIQKIPIYKPPIRREEIDAAKEEFEIEWLGMGSYVKDFEEKRER
jgi:hypothetical protein